MRIEEVTKKFRRIFKKKTTKIKILKIFNKKLAWIACNKYNNINKFLINIKKIIQKTVPINLLDNYPEKKYKKRIFFNELKKTMKITRNFQKKGNEIRENTNELFPNNF